MRMFKFFQVDDITGVPGGGSGGGGKGGGGAESELGEDLDILGDGEDEGLEEGEDEDEKGKDKGEEKDKGKGESKDQDKVDEEDEDEEEEKGKGDKDEKDDDEDKEPEPIKRYEGKPDYKTVKDAYPDVAKRFPGLRDTIFREAEFSKHFTDPAQAAETVDKALNYDLLETSLVDGNPDPLFQQLSENNPAAFKRVVGKLVPTLRGIDNRLYVDEIATPVIEELLQLAAAHGEAHNNPNLVKSARWIADYVFGNGGEIPDPKARTEKHPAEIELERERAKHRSEKQGGALQSVNVRIDRGLKGIITEGMSPRLTPFERERVIEKTLDELLDGVSRDRAFGQKMRGLWKRAELAQYSEQTLAAITNAHVARAKSIAREIRDRISGEALKGRVRRVERDSPDKEEKEQPPKKRQFDTAGRGGGGGRRETVLDSSKIDYSRTTDADILADSGGDRIRLKGQK